MNQSEKIGGELPFKETEKWRAIESVNFFVASKLAYTSSDPRNSEYTRRRSIVAAGQFTADEVRKLLPFLEDQRLADTIEKNLQEVEQNPTLSLSTSGDKESEILNSLMQEYNWDPEYKKRFEELLIKYSAQDIHESLHLSQKEGWIDMKRYEKILACLKRFAEIN